MARRERRVKRRFDVLAFSGLFIIAFSVLLAFGFNSTIYRRIFYYIPGFRFFGNPARIIFLFSYAMIVLAALGFHQLETTPSFGARFKDRFFLCFPLILTLIIVFGILQNARIFLYWLDSDSNLYALISGLRDCLSRNSQARRVLEQRCSLIHESPLL